MYKITSSVKTGGLLIFLLVFTLSFIIASTKTSVAGLTVTSDETTAVSCFGGNDGAIKISVTGGNSSYNYDWSGPNSYSSSVEDISSLKAGTYILAVSDTDGNTGEITIIVNQPNELQISGSTHTNVLCYGESNGTLTAGTVTGGNSEFEYSINGTTWQTSKTFQDLPVGTYTISVKDNKGCQTTSQPLIISQPNELVINNTDYSKPTCKGNKDGSIISIDVTGGTTGYQYKLNNGSYQNGKNFNGLGAGDHTIFVKDSNGCIATKTITITEPEALTLIGSSVIEPSCNGLSDGEIFAGNATGGTPPYEYKVNSRSYQTAQNFTGFSSGSYTVTVKDASGCTATEDVTVTQPDPLQISNTTFQEPDCNNTNTGTITIGDIFGGTAPYQFKITGSNYQTSKIFENIPAGTYTVTVLDDNACEATENVTVTEPDPLSISGSTPSPVSCNGNADGTVTAGTVSGGNSGFQYSIDGGTFSSSNTFTGLTAGEHTITVKDNKGCEATETITVTEPEVLSLTGSTTTPVSCNGESDGTATAGSVSGGNSGFQYSIDGGTFSSSNTFTGLGAGEHTITVKDNKGCEAAETITVTEPDPIKLTGSTTSPVSCNGGSDGTATAGTVSGGNSGFQFSIDGGGFSTAKTFTGLTAGNHTIIVRDNKGCETSETISIFEPEPLTATPASATPVSCNGGDNGTITAGTPSGGNGNYLYSIDGVSFNTSKTFTNLSAGTYDLTIKDSKNCELIQTVEVTQPDQLSMTDPSSTEATCFGGADGSITVGTMSGGNGNYQYSLDNINFTTSETFTGLTAGNYTIFVKDGKDCALQKPIAVSQPLELSANITKTDVSCFDGTNGTITLSQITGGHGNYEYSIDGTSWQSETTIQKLTSGTYSVYIRDAAYTNCVVVLNNSIQITQPAAPLTASVVTTRTTSYGTATGTATANATGGTPGYTYQWRNAGNSTVLQTTKTATNLSAGNYEVTVTDTKGCSYIKELTIIETIDAAIIPTSICSDNEEELIRTSYFEVEDLTARGGVGPYTYQWSFGSDSTPSSAAGPGSHEVKYSSTGNKNITLIVTDSKNVAKEFTYTQFVGECYRDNCGSNDFIASSYYVGDAAGNPATVANCNDSTQKYIHMTLSSGTDRYSLYAEITYTLTNVETGESNTVTKNGCFYENQVVPNKVKTITVPWECGTIITVDRIYLTFSNNIKWGCGQGPNPKCYSTNNQETVVSPLYATAKPNEILCFGDEFGTIEARASGGKAPYKYSITSAATGFQSESTFNNLPAGDYNVWVKDYDGLIYQVPTVTITQPDNPITLETTIINPTCYGELGEASVTAEGGTPFEDGTYEYLWNDANEQTTSTATGLPAGDYTITVIDANGCQTIKTVTISQPEEITVAETGEDQVFGCGFNTTNLVANTPVTGTGEWTIVSGTGGTITEPSNPNSEFTGESGTYVLRWTIAHPDGTCATTSDMDVTFASDCNTLDFDGINDHVTMGDNYQLSTGSFSIEVWVKPKSVSGVQTILSKRDFSNLTAGGFDLIINNGAPTFRWNGNSVSTSSKVTTARWYHLAVIYKNSTIELYVDGIKVGNSGATNPISTNAQFLLGAMYDLSNPDITRNHYHGWMEELRIWKTALTPVQLRFMMNQRILNNSGNTKGEVLPMDVPGVLAWSNLIGYYRLFPNEIINGETKDISLTPVNGYLKNIETNQKNTAPLPYISEATGNWRSRATWDVNIGNENENWWDVPNGKGINGDYINWNIAKISHNINSGAENIYLLGLFSESGELIVDGNVSSGTGQGLTISKYLSLNGKINLEGQSQLVQIEGSILEEESIGYIEIDQQGTANSFNYNYWTSPVSLIGNTNNSGFRINEVLLDGTDPDNPKGIKFNSQYHWADGNYNYSDGKRISTYWLHTFRGTADDYFEWHQFSETELLEPGIGYSMKGTTGYVPVSNRQNYTFKGKPNNADITVSVGTDQNLLTGNPYPSAIDAHQFIQDNLSDFNGSLYFWDHFGPVNSHYLEEYIGGYAVYNLSGGIASASSIDSRIDATGDQSQKGPPKRYIPVAQAFFINTIGASSPNSVTFKNKYRSFVPESSGDSQFHMQETMEKGQKANTYAKDNRFKIRLKYESPKGYHRQILVTADLNTTGGFDLGYDAPLIENNVEDMYWMIDDTEFVIQAVPNFNADQVLPLGIKISEKGEYTIKVDELENLKSDFKIYLRDKTSDVYYNLAKEHFTTTAEETGSFNDRYEIVFKHPEIDIPEKEKPAILDGINIGLQYLNDSDEISIINPDLMNVDYVQLFSISGQLIKTFREVPTSRAIILAVNQKLSSAVYIVKIYSGERTYSEKVIITK